MSAITVEHLSKSYLVGHNAARSERYIALRDVLARGARDLARKTRDMLRGRPIIQGDEVEEFWALKDVSFTVEHGETLGIIGRNGAGKSTLLKVLSRITEPTKGRVTIRGRVASLLEVGTGFHPELTGRENIYLNGAILGMTRREIKARFDEIVAFAEVEQFLDTPVKRYSSGMYVRLAFAVAAHLEPEILLVDEVLAVGDAEFQRKCLGKMGDVANEGRTVLFVSHNMTAVENLCKRCLFLRTGAVAQAGHPAPVILHYLDAASATYLPVASRADRQGSGKLRFCDVHLISSDGVARTGQEARIAIAFCLQPDAIPLRNVAISVSINSHTGHLLVFFTEERGFNLTELHQDSSLHLVIPFLPLAAATYSLNLYATVNGILADYLIDACSLTVIDAGWYHRGIPRNSQHPPFVAAHHWVATTPDLSHNRITQSAPSF